MSYNDDLDTIDIDTRVRLLEMAIDIVKYNNSLVPTPNIVIGKSVTNIATDLFNFVFIDDQD